MGRPLSRLCSWSGPLKVSWRIWVSALIRAPRAERLATTRTRIASTEPSLLLALPWARPERTARAASTASSGSDLPLWVSGLAVLAIDFDDVDSSSGEVTSDAGPIGPGPLHADFADFSEGFEPGQKIRVAVGVGPKRLRAEQATDLVQDGSYMDLPMGVDATSDGSRGFYDGRAIPSFP